MIITHRKQSRHAKDSDVVDRLYKFWTSLWLIIEMSRLLNTNVYIMATVCLKKIILSWFVTICQSVILNCSGTKL